MHTAERTEQVKEFGYLVSMITTEAKCHMEILKKDSDRRTFSKRNKLLRGKLDRNKKKRIIDWRP